MKRMSRRHVHFARGVPEALDSSPAANRHKERGESSGDDVVIGDQGGNEVAAAGATWGEEQKVISGMRANATIMIWVDVARSMKEGGLKWWRSENGVVLPEGDEQGTVSIRWVDRVELRGTGEILWRGEGEF